MYNNSVYAAENIENEYIKLCPTSRCNDYYLLIATVLCNNLSIR